jgi:hypothetical protein
MLPVLELLDSPAQIVILGTGEVRYEQSRRRWRHSGPPTQWLPYNESLPTKLKPLRTYS